MNQLTTNHEYTSITTHIDNKIEDIQNDHKNITIKSFKTYKRKIKKNDNQQINTTTQQTINEQHDVSNVDDNMQLFEQKWNDKNEIISKINFNFDKNILKKFNTFKLKLIKNKNQFSLYEQILNLLLENNDMIHYIVKSECIQLLLLACQHKNMTIRVKQKKKHKKKQNNTRNNITIIKLKIIH
jgi:hypothetical protein